jgi:hypothetical protein
MFLEKCLEVQLKRWEESIKMSLTILEKENVML